MGGCWVRAAPLPMHEWGHGRARRARRLANAGDPARETPEPAPTRRCVPVLRSGPIIGNACVNETCPGFQAWPPTKSSGWPAVSRRPPCVTVSRGGESARTSVHCSPAVSSSVLGQGQGTVQQGPEPGPSTERGTVRLVCRTWKLPRGHCLIRRHRPHFLSVRVPHARAVDEDSPLREDCFVRTLGTVSERLWRVHGGPHKLSRPVRKHAVGCTSGWPDERTRPPWTPTGSRCALFTVLVVSGVMGHSVATGPLSPPSMVQSRAFVQVAHAQ